MDEHGVRVSTAEQVVTFEVVSGPGRVMGVGSGDPEAHNHQQSNACATYLGSAKVMVQVTVDCTTPGRSVAMLVDLESGKDGTVTVAEDCSAHLAQGPIVVKATTASGLVATASVAISGDVAADGWLAIASNTGSNLNYTYLVDFVE